MNAAGRAFQRLSNHRRRFLPGIAANVGNMVDLIRWLDRGGRGLHVGGFVVQIEQVDIAKGSPLEMDRLTKVGPFGLNGGVSDRSRQDEHGTCLGIAIRPI